MNSAMTHNGKSKMEFLKLIQTRFADPITAIDLSKKYVCHGSAMGRIAFYDLQ